MVEYGGIKNINMDKKTENEKTVSDYYRNLLNAVDIHTYADIDLDISNLSDEQAVGLEYAIRLLNENEQEILHLRYGEGMSFRAIGEHRGISVTRAGQIHARAVWKLRQPSCYVWYTEGFTIHDAKRKSGAERIRKSLQKRREIGILEKSCMKLGISYGLYEKLQKAGLGTIGNLQNAMKRRTWHDCIRGVGVKQAGLLVCRMMEAGLIDESYAAVQEYSQQKRKSAAQDNDF